MSTSEPDAGYRFRRPLSAEEMTEVERVMRSNGGAAGFRALWDVILSEAEGVTWDDAVERRLKFRPGDYAVPLAQANELLALMTKHRGRNDKPISVSMTWLSDGPTSYEA
jgi:hypothetical protein